MDVLRGVENERVLENEFQKLSTYGLMRGKTIVEVRRLLDALRMQGYLQQTDGERPVLCLLPAARGILLGEKKFEMRVPVAPEKSKVRLAEGTADVDEVLFEKLKKLRAKLASRQSVPAYVVFTDATLRELSAVKPKNEQEMLRISGVGEKKAARYGKAFLAEICTYCADQ